MKRLIGLLLILVIFMVGCSSNQANNSTNDKGDTSSNNEDVIELTLDTWYPTNDPIVENVYTKWEEIVKEKTDGRVVIKSFHANALGPANTMLQDIAGGLYDIGFVSPILFDDTEVFPYTISNLAFAFPEGKSASNVMNKFLEKYQAPKDVEYLGISNSDSYIIWSKEPIKKIEDMKNMKLRAASEVQIELAKSFGASPVSVPVADIYEALQKGTLDAALFPMVGGEAWNYHEVAPNVTTVGLSTPAFMPSINKDSFNKLPDDLKKLFKDELGPELAQLFTDHNYEYTNKAIENLKQNSKGEVITISEEELTKFQKGSKPIWDAWVKEATDKGYDGKAMMKDFQAFIKDEGLKLPF